MIKLPCLCLLDISPCLVCTESIFSLFILRVKSILFFFSFFFGVGKVDDLLWREKKDHVIAEKWSLYE